MPGLTRDRLCSGLRALSLLYASSLLGWQLLGRELVAEWWPYELIDIFGGWLYLPLPPLLLLAALFRDRPAAIWLVVPLLAFGLEYGPRFGPRPAPEPGIPFRVLTVNLSHGNSDVQPFVEMLAEQQPDLVAIQELGSRFAARLPWSLRHQYPYQRLYAHHSSLGMGILSRYPIEAELPPAMIEGACFCQQVSVEIADRRVTVLNVHPPLPDIAYAPLAGRALPSNFRAPAQDPSLRAILQRGEAIEGPLLVLGDFNVADRQRSYRLLSERLQDSHLEAGWGFGYTYPSEIRLGPLALAVPLMRIDYIFHRGTWSSRAAWTASLAGSDHRYVAADLVLR